VVSSTSGLARIVASGHGLTYEPEEAPALAACLRRFANQELRVRLGEAGRTFAETELSWEHSAERYVEIYREAIALRASS
jgi:glycosyltransferase involved in cell wall biosynthesis